MEMVARQNVAPRSNDISLLGSDGAFAPAVLELLPVEPVAHFMDLKFYFEDLLGAKGGPAVLHGLHPSGGRRRR